MIIPLGGGGKEAFAAIGVTYPVGSTCACSNGTKTFTAEDTSGQYVFVIPEVGTWTVECTDGVESVSKEVVIEAKGQAVQVKLGYTRIIFDNGNLGISGGFTNATVGDTIVVSASAQSTKTSKSVNLFATQGYSTLEVDMGKSASTYSDTNYGRATFGLMASGETTFAASFEVSKAARDVYTLDISNLPDLLGHNFALKVYGNYDSTQKATIYSIKLLP